MFKCFNLNLIILPKRSDIHNYKPKDNINFIAPKYTMKKSVTSKNFKSIKVWNKLPADIRTSDSLNVLMNNLRNHGEHLTLLTSSLMYFLFLLHGLSLYNVTNNRTILRVLSVYFKVLGCPSSSYSLQLVPRALMNIFF